MSNYTKDDILKIDAFCLAAFAKQSVLTGFPTAVNALKYDKQGVRHGCPSLNKSAFILAFKLKVLC